MKYKLTSLCLASSNSITRISTSIYISKICIYTLDLIFWIQEFMNIFFVTLFSTKTYQTFENKSIRAIIFVLIESYEKGFSWLNQRKRNINIKIFCFLQSGNRLWSVFLFYLYIIHHYLKIVCNIYNCRNNDFYTQDNWF